MRLMEMLLRLACGLVAWMLAYTQLIWLSVVYQTGCGADGVELFRLLLGFAVFVVPVSFALSATRPVTEVHGILKWLSIPMLALGPLALIAIWPFLRDVNLGGAALCDTPDLPWGSWWAPLQLVALAAIAWNVWRVWQPDRATIEAS